MKKGQRVQLTAEGHGILLGKDDATGEWGKARPFPARVRYVVGFLLLYLAQRGICYPSGPGVDERASLSAPQRSFRWKWSVRFQVAGLLAQRTGLPPEKPCTPPIYELFTNATTWAIDSNDEHVRLLGLATESRGLPSSARSLCALQRFAAACSCARGAGAFHDLKFGVRPLRRRDRASRRISPDMRIRDVRSGQVLDRMYSGSRYRRALSPIIRAAGGSEPLLVSGRHDSMISGAR